MKKKSLLLTAVATICIAVAAIAQPQIQQNDTSICKGESINLNLIGILPDSSNCIGNLGTPNPWPYPSAINGGYIPIGTLGAQSVFSISMWINPAAVQNGISIIIDASHGGSSNWVIQTLNSGSSWTWGNGVFTLMPNTWQHLLLTYNNGNRKVFVNGVQIQSWFQTISYSGSPALYLGNWPEGGRRFNGLIDELYITTDILYSNNFTPMEIVQNPSANTFGLWHFDEGAGINTNNTLNISYPLNSWYWSTRDIASGSQSTILWSTGENTENINVSPNNNTQYTVSVNDGTTTFNDTININVLGNSLVITPLINQLQTGSTATFIATTSDPNPSFIWQSDFGQGFQTLNNIGNYSGTNTATLNISNVQISEHNQQIRASSSSGNCIDTSNVSVINILDTCITNVTVYDTLLTTVTDTLVINTNIVGMNPPNSLNTIKVFPNPASTHITIDYGNFAIMNGYQLVIENSLGQQVFQTNITQQSDYLSLSAWGGNGLYFVHIIDPQGNTIDIRKIVLQ